MMERYTIVYENDTGPNDDYFWEWWTVFDGDTKICECPSEEMAAKIVAALTLADKATGQ